MPDKGKDHNYLSSECEHKQHKACRVRCRICEALCKCFCHNSLRRSYNMLKKLEELV